MQIANNSNAKFNFFRFILWFDKARALQVKMDPASEICKRETLTSSLLFEKKSLVFTVNNMKL